MKYYQEDILQRWSAKFKDSQLEESFHAECFSKRFKIAYLISIQVIVSCSLQFFVLSQYNAITISQFVAAIIVMFLLKYVPMKYSQFVIMLGQIYSTYTICLRNNQGLNHYYEIYYLNGIIQAMFWMVEVQNFPAEAITMIINQMIIAYLSQIPYVYRTYYPICIFIFCAYKYFHNINDRKLFLSLKSFQQWEKIFEKIIPNLFILQSFDYRTNKMSVYDCNKKAKQYNIHKSQDKYIEFLNKFQIENIYTSKNLPMCNQKSSQELKTLKDYLLYKHATIYTNFVQDKTNQMQKFKQMKTKANKTIEQKQKKENNDFSDQNNVETLNVSLTQDGKLKKTLFKVSIYNILMNEPFLVVCFEDMSLVQKVKNLEDTYFQKEDLVQELVSCVIDKLNSIKQAQQTSIQYMQRLITQTQVILQAFLQKLRPIQIQSFTFNEVIEKIQLFYSDLDFKIQGNLSHLQMNSDKGFIFLTIMSFISGLGAENVESLDLKLAKDKFCEKVMISIQSRCCYQNLEDISQMKLFEIKKSSNLNHFCWKYIKNMIKQICLQDKPKIKLLDSDCVIFQIEYITDLNILIQDKKLLHKSLQKSQISREQTKFTLSNVVPKAKQPFIQLINQQSQHKYASSLNETSKRLDSTKLDLTSPFQKLDLTNTNLLSFKQ
ncbi:hypothetical protein ABPG72_008852 [Tetrahymena utriculariae]